MDDNSSIASFEDIGPSDGRVKPTIRFKSSEETNIEKLKSLIAKSAAKGDIARELTVDEVPDVCYVLRHKGWGGNLVDLRRSDEPINVRLDDTEEDTSSSVKKPILEIVTEVSTSLISKNRRQDHFVPPAPPFPRGWDESIDYGGHNRNHYADLLESRQRKQEKSEMSFASEEETVMVINSIHLINALKAVVGYYPSTFFIGDQVKIKAPYHVLVHHRAALARYKVSQPETHDQEYAFTTAKHIDVLLTFLEKALGEQIREEEKRHNSTTPSATFNMLWLLLKPGEVIYAKHNYMWTPFVISSVIFQGSNGGDSAAYYTINCWNITHSMERLRRMTYSFYIDEFSGDEAVTKLPIIPARFFRGHDDDMAPEDVAAKQISLGQRVWQLSKGPSYMFYDGTLVQNGADADYTYSASAAGSMSGRVIVDCEGFARFFGDSPGNRRRRPTPRPQSPNPVDRDNLPYFAPRCGCGACARVSNEDLSPFAGFEELNPTEDEAPKADLYYLVLTNIVSGFILGDRRWGHFNVECLQDVKFDQEAFKYLILDDEIKLTVKALVGKFASNNGQVSPWPNDFVKNKGQGRIFLLHGSPGVGKTCTAECAAELAHRPLLSLTSGDLSTNSHQVERNLDYFLQLGERFGAMVLLDEADVYLEARRAKDIARNGLVSVFLRALEYYRGVLFLTTNRVGAFDGAFTSRIHVALHYRAFSDADRERIWLHSFERLERDSAGRVHVAVATREYAYASRDVRGLRWNGREIRNALQTAVALAETEALEDGADRVTVTDRHLRAVVRMSRGFKNFLRQRKLRGGNDEADVDGGDDDDDDDDDEVETDESGEGSMIYDD
ncbi:P-loop containing nucleoside triphosphate hydrolase protein [Xylariaceae sp. FL0662B]|nr:P-loop containing nucleoside triphosphate hydrolase protein [Xylariaceae sp. FL0662B]